MKQTMNTKPLEGLLVLCITHNGLSFETEATIDRLTEAGASKIRTNGNSDVALHRCQIAGAARDLLVSDTGRFHSVLWLDGDMMVDVVTVRELFRLTLFTATQRPIPPELRGKPLTDQAMYRLKNAPAISGAYVKRNDPAHYAMAPCIPPIEPLVIHMQEPGEAERVYSMPGVVSGLGALCQTAMAFLEHCKEAPAIKQTEGTTFPAICASGPGKNAEGEIAWGSEDWTYGSWEWQQGRGVFLATELRFGHLAQRVQWPDEKTSFFV